VNDFSFLFALYSLMLGLSIVELLGGLGRVLEARLTADRGEDVQRVTVGWLTPLLAVFVMLDLISFWMAAWTVRDMLTVSGPLVVGLVAFASLYFLAARLVFPSAVTATSNLDTHYFRVHRTVLGLLLLLMLVQLAFYATLPALAAVMRHTLVWGASALFVVLIAAAIWVKGRTISIILLSLMVARYLAIMML
jgi:hypothetical protein